MNDAPLDRLREQLKTVPANDIADRAGVIPLTVHRLRNGQGKPKPETLSRIETALSEFHNDHPVFHP